MLQSVRTSIQKTYGVTSIGGDGQVVVVAFEDGITFEILPVFDNKSGCYTFADSNGGGSWKQCDPRAEMTAFSNRDAATNGNLKAIGRMARIWKRRHGVLISGMLLDTLAYQFIENWAERDKSFLYHDWLMRDFLLYLSKIDAGQTYWRAPGSASYVSKSGNFQRQAAESYQDALSAISHESNDRPATARNKWREVFGSTYP